MGGTEDHCRRRARSRRSAMKKQKDNLSRPPTLNVGVATSQRFSEERAVPEPENRKFNAASRNRCQFTLQTRSPARVTGKSGRGCAHRRAGIYFRAPGTASRRVAASMRRPWACLGGLTGKIVDFQKVLQNHLNLKIFCHGFHF